MAKTILYYIVVVAACVMFALGVVLVGNAWGQHPLHDQEIHENFYSTWRMPNGDKPRVASCCNEHDCYPATIKREGGTWFAQSRDGQRWIAIPDSKLEHLQGDPRESPDGRSHVCIPITESGVYCAVLGNGI